MHPNFASESPLCRSDRDDLVFLIKQEAKKKVMSGTASSVLDPHVCMPPEAEGILCLWARCCERGHSEDLSGPGEVL
jgi:hypothetical protein